MYLTLTNLGDEPELLATPSGDYTAALQPGQPLDVADDARDVLLVGDKPDALENIQRGLATLGAIARHILEAIIGRKRDTAERYGQPERVRVSIENHGAQAVRVILGDGVTDVQVQPGTAQVCEAVGYLELRELGNVQQPPGQVEAP